MVTLMTSGGRFGCAPAHWLLAGWLVLAGGCTAPVAAPPTVEAHAGAAAVPATAPALVPTVAATNEPSATLLVTPPVTLAVTLAVTPTAVAFVFPTVTPSLVPTLAPVEEATAPAVAPYRFSPLYEGLAAAYPAALDVGRFVLHYTPATLPAQDPQSVADLVLAALAHHEQLLSVTVAGSFDVYAAGSLFAPPDQALRGRSFSGNRRMFFLDDGSGTPVERAYIAAHELTHLVAWNTLGVPSSVMLSEGLAVYAGMDFPDTNFVDGQELLPLANFCAAYRQADALPHITQELDYLGHIRNLENYYSAGCFVQFLIERYGAGPFGQLYPSGDYGAVYGKSLAELEAEWLADPAQWPTTLAYPPRDLVTAVTQVENAYTNLFAAFDGSPAQLDAYRTLDGVRMALLMGRLDQVQAFFGQ